MKDLMKAKKLPSLCELLMIGDVLQEIRDTTTLQTKSRGSIDFKLPSPSKPSKTRQRIMDKKGKITLGSLIYEGIDSSSDSNSDNEMIESIEPIEAEKEASDTNNPSQSSSSPISFKKPKLSLGLAGL